MLCPPLAPLPACFELGSFTGLEFTKKIRLTDEQAPDSLVSTMLTLKNLFLMCVDVYTPQACSAHRIGQDRALDFLDWSYKGV